MCGTCVHTGQPCYLADLFKLRISYVDRLEFCDLLNLTFLLFLPVLSVLLPLELFVYLTSHNYKLLSLEVIYTIDTTSLQ